MSNQQDKVLATISTVATIKPHSVCVSQKFYNCRKNPNAKANLWQFNSTSDGDVYNGYLSPNTKRQIKKILDNWLEAITLNVDLKLVKKAVNRSQVFPTFVTLTLPSKQLHSDLTIKNKCLDPFIEWLRGSDIDLGKSGLPVGCGVKCYFWRAEVQRNGNIHFHLIIDKYVPWDRLRLKWNQMLERLGYVKRYADYQRFLYTDGFFIRQSQLDKQVASMAAVVAGFEKTKKLPNKCNKRLLELLKASKRRGKVEDKMFAIRKIAVEIQRDAYFESLWNDWLNPNSTDIIKIKHYDSLASYVVKYVSKDCEEKPLADGERLVVEDGKKYVHYTSNGEEFKKTYKPVFIVRKVRGRLWGCSDTLRNKKLEYQKVELQEESSLYSTDRSRAAQPYYRATNYINQDGCAWIDSLSIKHNKRDINRFVYIIFSKIKIEQSMPPDYRVAYRKHYRTIYQTIYG